MTTVEQFLPFPIKCSSQVNARVVVEYRQCRAQRQRRGQQERHRGERQLEHSSGSSGYIFLIFRGFAL